MRFYKPTCGVILDKYTLQKARDCQLPVSPAVSHPHHPAVHFSTPAGARGQPSKPRGDCGHLLTLSVRWGCAPAREVYESRCPVSSRRPPGRFLLAAGARLGTILLELLRSPGASSRGGSAWGRGGRLEKSGQSWSINLKSLFLFIYFLL